MTRRQMSPETLIALRESAATLLRLVPPDADAGVPGGGVGAIMGALSAVVQAGYRDGFRDGTAQGAADAEIARNLALDALISARCREDAP